MGDAKRRRALMGDEAYFAGDPRWKYGFRRQEPLPSADAWMTSHTASCKLMQRSTVVTKDGQQYSLSGFDDQSYSTASVRAPTKRVITCRACHARAQVRQF